MVLSVAADYLSWIEIGEHLKGVLPHEPLRMVLTVGVTQDGSRLSSEVLQDIKPGLQRFQDFHDDLRILVDRLPTPAFAKVLESAHTELTAEANRIAASAGRAKDDVRIGTLALRDAVVGDICIEGRHRHSMRLCERYYDGKRRACAPL